MNFFLKIVVLSVFGNNFLLLESAENEVTNQHERVFNGEDVTIADFIQEPATLDLFLSLSEKQSYDEVDLVEGEDDEALLAEQESSGLLDDFIVNEQIVIDADSTINGLGNKLIFGQAGQLVINEGVTLTLKNIIIVGLEQDHILFNGQDSQLLLSDVRVRLASDVSFDEGTVTIDGDVSFKGPFVFEHNSVGGLSIEPLSRLFMDLGTTFKSFLLTFKDTKTSELYLNGASLAAGSMGLVIDRGVIICDNRVLLSGDVNDQNKGLYIMDNALVKVLAGARVEHHGYVSLS